MVRHLKARPRLVFSTLFGCSTWFFVPEYWRSTTRLLFCWDAGVGLYLLLVVFMMMKSGTAKMRSRAAAQDEGRTLILLLTIITSIASLAAIIAELSHAKGLSGITRNEHIGLAAITVLLSWTFMQTIFALHYAHEYYMQENGRNAEGLAFPGEDGNPDYWDFIYYSFVIGTAAQTADVNITSKNMRRLATVHCTLCFFFNTTVLALTVNIGASLF